MRRGLPFIFIGEIASVVQIWVRAVHIWVRKDRTYCCPSGLFATYTIRLFPLVWAHQVECTIRDTHSSTRTQDIL